VTLPVFSISYKRFRSEIFWILLGHGGVLLGGMTGIKLLTQSVSPVEFGRFALANTLVLLIGTNVFGPVGQGVMRFWSITGERGERAVFSRLSGKIIHQLSLWILGIGAGSATVVFFWKDWGWGILVFVAIAAGILSGWAGVRLSVLMAARERKRVALINTCAAFAKPLAGVLLIYFFIADAVLILAGYTISLCVVVIVCENQFKKLVSSTAAVQDRPQNRVAGNHCLKNELSAFIWPFYIWGIFGWMHQSCDRWAIQSFHGTEVVGAFFVISQLALYPLVAGSSFLSTFFIPIAYQKAGGSVSGTDFRSATRIISAMTGFFFIGSAALILLYVFFHEHVVLLISSDQFTVYSTYLPWLTGAWALYYLGQMFAGFGLLANKPGLYITPIIVSGVLVTLLSFLLSSIYGVLGVVWAIGVSGAVYALWAFMVSFSLIRKVESQDVY
jgi:O-antigen/teichoic acid export membrane protein